MMDEFIHRPNPYFLLSTTYAEILVWMIKNWMKNHLVSDNTCNTVNLLIPQGMTNDVVLTFSVGDLYIPRFTIKSGDIGYHI